MQINAIDEEFFTLRKNHAIGKVAFDIYQEFSVIFAKQKEDLVKAYEKLDQKLSNPKELIDFTSRLAFNLPSAWACGDYYQKQTFQNTLFPLGVVYDVKIEHYRTEKVNSVIELTSHLSNDSEEIKKPVLSDFEDKTGLVPRKRLELSRLAAYAPQAYLYTIPTPGQVILLNNSSDKRLSRMQRCIFFQYSIKYFNIIFKFTQACIYLSY